MDRYSTLSLSGAFSWEIMYDDKPELMDVQKASAILGIAFTQYALSRLSSIDPIRYTKGEIHRLVATTLTIITGGSRKRDGWDRAFYPLAASVGDDDHHGLYSRWRVTSMCSRLPCCHTFSSCTRIRGMQNLLESKATRTPVVSDTFHSWAVYPIAFTFRRTEVHPVFRCWFLQQSCVLGDFTIDLMRIKVASVTINIRLVVVIVITSDFLARCLRYHIFVPCLRPDKETASEAANMRIECSNVRKSTRSQKMICRAGHSCPFTADNWSLHKDVRGATQPLRLLRKHSVVGWCQILVLFETWWDWPRLVEWTYLGLDWAILSSMKIYRPTLC
jgi:hypothetical protein